MLRRPRPLHEPRRILESDAKAYLPAVASGVAIGLLLLAVLLVVERRQRAAVNPGTGPLSEIVLEPVAAESSAPLGAFGACVQERLTATSPDGAETDAEMRAAQDACLPLLELVTSEMSAEDPVSDTLSD